ncbi:MAG: hypothetical protein QM820_23525 [Minicystis sp.]
MTITIKQWKAWEFDHGDRWHNDWQPLSPKAIADAGERLGVYVLALPRSRCPMGRLLQADPRGILAVGSGNLEHRLSELLQGMTSPALHMAGWRQCLGSLNIKPSNVRVMWCDTPDDDMDEAREIERAILRAYNELFGEPPPLHHTHNYASTDESHVRSLIAQGKFNFRMVFERLQSEGFVDDEVFEKAITSEYTGPRRARFIYPLMYSMTSDFAHLAELFFPDVARFSVRTGDFALPGGVFHLKVIYRTDLACEHVAKLVTDEYVRKEREREQAEDE